jgi:amino acid adenylation domain-containing protein
LRNIKTKRGDFAVGAVLESNLIDDACYYNNDVNFWNQTDNNYPNKTFIQLFEDQVSKSPDNIAVIYGREQMTYRQLDKSAHRLAKHIRKHYLDVKNNKSLSDTLISLCFDRGINMIIAILGVLKAGAAYVPIDPSYPKVRISHILKDTKSQLLLTEPVLKNKIEQILDSSRVDIDILSVNEIPDTDEANDREFLANSNNKDLAYVLYTSGTTGQPKGVMINNEAFSLFLQGFANRFKCKPNVLSLTYYTFDIFGLEYGLPLISGSTLILSNINNFKKDFLTHKNKIQLIQQTPSVLSLLLDELPTIPNPLEITCLVGGEAASKNLITRLNKFFKTVINVYGPTETTIWSTAYYCKDGQNYIGKPLDNEKTYLLDKNMKPVAIGEIGELYIGGAGLARGYLNLPKQTNERFIENPFASSSDIRKGQARLYKTGDFARYLPDGNIEFLGRNDFQIKIRGHRIELGEIENALISLKGIKQCVVIPIQKNSVGTENICLVAYYVANNKLQEDKVTQYLLSQLPDYMVPQHFIQLESLPLTSNGKIDRKALPTPILNDSQGYIPPRNDLEKKICHVWESILNVSRIGIMDDFFSFGGNSILAIRCVNRMSEILGYPIMVADIFLQKTISNLLNYAGKSSEILIDRTDKNTSELSYAQERLWFIEQYENGSSSYHLPMLFELEKDANRNAITSALESIINRHEVLRTQFYQDESGKTMQIVTQKNIKIKNCIFKDDESFTSRLVQDINESFDLRNELPIRACYYNLQSSNKEYLFINVHHIAFDGWSIDIFMKELGAFYRHLRNKDELSLPSMKIQYKDFALWQREYLLKNEVKTQLKYWQGKIRGYETLQLPIDKPRPARFDYKGETVSFEISDHLSKKIRALAKENGCSLYTVLLSGFYAFLYHYTGQKDIIIGTPIANRHYPQLQELIGFFVNSIALRIQFNPENDNFLTLIKQIQAELINAQRHQDVPFEKLVDALGVERDTSRHPIFQTMFGVQSFGNVQDNIFQQISLDHLYTAAKFDLSVFIDDGQEKLRGIFNYASSLYDQATIKRMVEHYKNILEVIVEDSQKLICKSSILTESEYQKIIFDWNQTNVSYPSEKTIVQLFEKQVNETPDHIAVVFDNEKLSYRELNSKANQLARYIRKFYKENYNETLQLGSLITLCLDRNINIIISILAVLKAGCAYVPLDPNYPDERINFILADANAKLVITEDYLYDKFQAVGDEVKLVAINKVPYTVETDENLLLSQNANSLAYIIYTSGTTGKPKGVMVKHQGVNNMVCAQHNDFKIDSYSTILQFASIVFDASVWEIFNALTCGAKLMVISDRMRREPNALLQYIEDEKVNVATLPPALLSQARYKKLPSLRTLIVAGESCDPKTMNLWCKDRDFINAYGPTEATVCATLHHYKLGDNPSNIGKPIQNMQVYILNSYKKPAPIGVVGELYIGGAGLAVGYLNQTDLTNERFVVNPFATFSDKNNTRLYKTGDLARYLPDGNIEFVGRNDFQVKIRGYRIELSEIEGVFLEHHEITKCLVTVAENTSSHTQQLIAYYVANNPLDEDDLRKKLCSNLPEYMQPHAIIHVNELPMTINGKIDIKALPKPFLKLKNDYVAPRSDLEHSLCNIWYELLGIDSIGVHDNFFYLGGNSILAIQLVARISQKLGMTISVADIFVYKTIANLVSNLSLESAVPITKHMARKSSLSFSQESLWFVEQYENGSSAYHIPMLFDLKEDVNINHLNAAIQAVVNRHSILRTVIYQDKNGLNYQKICNKKLLISSQSFDTKHAFDDYLSTDINRPFNLKNEQPIRITYYKLDNEHKILINVHHIAFDGWSTAIFLQEIEQFYQYYNQNVVMNLPNLDIQYKDYAIWQRKNLSNNKLEKQISYWKENLKDFETLNFPLDKARPTKKDYSGSNIEFSFSSDLSNQIRKLAKEKGFTLYTILLAAYYLLIQKYSGQNDIIIGTPSANRHHPQVQSLIGYFVNSLPLRINCLSTSTIDSLFETVNNIVTQAQRHQDVSFDQLVNQLNIERDLSRHPLFQIMFSLQSFSGHNDIRSSSWRTPSKNLIENGTAKFDLLLVIDDDPEEDLKGYFNYATSLFEHETIARLSAHYQEIIKNIIQSANCYISEFNFMTPIERQQILLDWNKTEVNYDSHKTLTQKFEEQVLKTPYNIALDFEGLEMTYEELNKKANQLARYLRNKYQCITGSEITQDTIVAIYFNRSIEMLVSILAILKSGAAYVPLSPEHPSARIKDLIQDSQAALVLTHESLQSSLLPMKTTSVLSVDLGNYNDEDSSNLPAYSNPESLACVLYTSGTTGTPKGVLIEHKSVINHIEWLQSKFHLTENDVVIQKAAYIYDASVRELLWANWYGAKTVIAKPDGQKDSGYLYDLVTKHSAKVIHFIPTMLDAFLIHIESIGKNLPSSLSFMICGGEILNESLVDKCYSLSQHDDFLLYNVYGPTETTINVTHAIRNKERAGVIGRPNNNTSAYIVDANLQPVPIGAIGELYIGGAGLARGYLNLPQQTKERFIKNPFATECDKKKGYTRLYKTGDLARYLPDGNIECIGRNDFQVKIRGYRIELGEIEKEIVSLDSIKQCVVMTSSRENSGGSNQFLVAYYISENSISNDIITEALAKKFPDYMIPSIFVHMQSLPTTITGKLDRKALPKPDLNTLTMEYIKPRNEVEETLCQIWEEILEINRIGINDDFFYLGGNSILTIQLLARILRKFNVSISLKDIFENRTVSNISKIISQSDSLKTAYTTQLTPRIDQPVISYQQKLILDYVKSYPKSILFQSGIALMIDSNIDVGYFKSGLKKTLGMYPLFRTKFNLINNEYVPIVNDIDSIDLSAVFSYEEKNIGNSMEQKNYAEQVRLDMAQIIFNYGNDFLYSFKLIKVADCKCILICCMSRLLADGYSLSMFIKSLFKNYQSISLGQAVSYQSELDYFDYSEWQRKVLIKKNMKNKLEYWKNNDLIKPERKVLTYDKINTSILDGLCGCEKIKIDPKTTEKIRLFSKNNNISTYSIFFGVWAIYLFEKSSLKDINIACVHRNRNRLEFEAIQGPFSDYLPIRIKDFPDYAMDKIGYLKYIDNLIRDGLDNAVPYGELLNWLGVNKNDTLRHSNFPLTQTAVNFPSPYVNNIKKHDDNLISFERIENTKHTTTFDVSVVISENESSYSISLNYREELFYKETMLHALKEYFVLIDKLV